ncbi:unnamed protein product [Bursaphelenchus okinawaensis]|uniref:Uncharacterized protein n=1 Tax=Bursaphelenchus okinawaensis TaxID=465554 RepID=A0A811KC26_9BILA|nr:unnamed protein product [Bursaphelenchus okinawaensis]CAG9101357.1 unnamed protein product [Bursaphelenchus okinawaensis]
MVATNLAALLPKIVALTLLSLPSDRELCVTYTTFKESSNELKATKFTQCESTEMTSGTPAGIFKTASTQYKLLQLYPVNTALDSILFSRLAIVSEKTQYNGLSLLKVAPAEPKLLKQDVNAKEAQFGVANGHMFFQNCEGGSARHIDMANLPQGDLPMTHEGLIICGKPEFGQTKDGLVWTEAEGCWTLDGDNLKPSDRSDVTELVFTIEALVNMDPTIAQDVDQADLKTMLVLVHSQLAPQTTCTTTTPAGDTTELSVTEMSKSPDYFNMIGYAVGGFALLLVFCVVGSTIWYTGCLKRKPTPLQPSTTPSEKDTTPVDSKDPASKTDKNTSNSKSGFRFVNNHVTD